MLKSLRTVLKQFGEFMILLSFHCKFDKDVPSPCRQFLNCHSCKYCKCVKKQCPEFELTYMLNASKNSFTFWKICSVESSGWFVCNINFLQWLHNRTQDNIAFYKATIKFEDLCKMMQRHWSEDTYQILATSSHCKCGKTQWPDLQLTYI